MNVLKGIIPIAEKNTPCVPGKNLNYLLQFAKLTRQMWEMFFLRGSSGFQVWWAPVSALARKKLGQEQAISLSCLWAPSSINSFHLFLSPVVWIMVDSCLGLMSFVWKWTIWKYSGTQSIIFHLDQEISDRTGNYWKRNEQMNITMDLFLADNIRLSRQKCNSLKLEIGKYTFKE